MDEAIEALEYDFLDDSQIAEPADATYSQDIPEPLCPGSCIIIRGTVKPQCKR